MNLKARFFRALFYLSTATHLRHFRGHGIHSPYAYNLVRNTIYKRNIVGGDQVLFEAMRTLGMPRRAAVQIQNICHYLHFKGFRIIASAAEVSSFDAGTLYLTHPNTSIEEMLRIFRGIYRIEGSMIVLFPRSNARRHRLCHRLSKLEEFLSIDNRRFTLWQFGHKLPKQRYKL